MLVIDGSEGEGGGQILRTSLSLAMVTGTPVRIEQIRARRAKPGLMRQHLTAVQAAARVSNAQVEGAEVGATALTFRPGVILPGEYHFAIGTAGSTALILQTLLPALLRAGGPSRVTLEGGTHNPGAPPFDFLDRVFLPLVRRMGPRIEAVLERPGFYPAGGGRFTVTVEPSPSLSGFELLERGEVRRRQGTVMLANLSRHIGEREIKTLVKATGWDAGQFELREVSSPGPGNAVLLELESDALTEIFTAFGEVRVPAEAVADKAVQEMRRYLTAGVPVGEHLADQLLLPMALAGSGAFAALPLARHAATQVELIPRFLPVRIEVERTGSERCVVRIA